MEGIATRRRPILGPMAFMPARIIMGLGPCMPNGIGPEPMPANIGRAPCPPIPPKRVKIVGLPWP